MNLFPIRLVQHVFNTKRCPLQFTLLEVFARENFLQMGLEVGFSFEHVATLVTLVVADV